MECGGDSDDSADSGGPSSDLILYSCDLCGRRLRLLDFLKHQGGNSIAFPPFWAIFRAHFRVLFRSNF